MRVERGHDQLAAVVFVGDNVGSLWADVVLSWSATNPSWPGLTGPSIDTHSCSNRWSYAANQCLSQSAAIKRPVFKRQAPASRSRIQPIEQVLPSRVPGFNQIQLPRPRPTFKAFLPADRAHDLLMSLHEHKSIEPISNGKSRVGTLPVLPGAARDIICYADVERAERPVRHDVNPAAHHDATIAQRKLRNRELHRVLGIAPGVNRRAWGTGIRAADRAHRPGVVVVWSDPRVKPEDDGDGLAARPSAS